MNSHPDWEALLAFHAAAGAGSLSQAAAALGLSQPTLSRRIDALEQSLGGKVLIRDTRGCRLTELGARLLPSVEQMHAEAERVQLLANAHRAHIRGTVRLACGPLPGQHLARNLARVVGGHPGLHLEVAPSAHFANLPGGEADLAMRNQRPSKGDWVSRRVRRSRFGVFAPKTLLEARPELAEAWGEAPWVGYPAGHDAPSARWLRARLGREADQRFSSSLAILEAAASGAGLAALPLYAGRADPRLTQLGEPLQDLGFDVWLVLHPATRELPAVRWVADRVVELFTAPD